MLRQGSAAGCRRCHDLQLCFECTFCRDCAQTTLGGRCPNCGGELAARPIRRAEKLATYPASTKRVLKTGRLRQSSNPTCSATEGTTCADLQTARAVPRRAGRDCMLAVVAGDRDELVQDLRPFNAAAGAIPISYCRHQLCPCGHADPPCHALPSSSPVGSIAAEATDSAGNIQSEAMRPIATLRAGPPC